jgi:molybdenum cofactor biosynthesis protein B
MIVDAVATSKIVLMAVADAEGYRTARTVLDSIDDTSDSVDRISTRRARSTTRDLYVDDRTVGMNNDSDVAEENDHHHSEHEHDHDHGHHHHDIDNPNIAVITVSSSRTKEDDPAGDTIESTLEAADHSVVTRDIVPDDHGTIQSFIDKHATDSQIDAIVTTGGTGVTPDDVTIEAVSSLFSKDLPGFGELFRQLSYDEIGTRVVGTRATAGVVNGVPVFCLPGSENAARLGSEEIIANEVSHLAGLAQREDE